MMRLWKHAALACILALGLAASAQAFVPQVSNPSTSCSDHFAVTVALQNSWMEDGVASHIINMTLTNFSPYDNSFWILGLANATEIVEVFNALIAPPLGVGFADDGVAVFPLEHNTNLPPNGQQRFSFQINTESIDILPTVAPTIINGISCSLVNQAAASAMGDFPEEFICGCGPLIIGHPQNTVADPGSTVMLTVTAPDADEYMWLRDGVVISEFSPDPSLVIESADPETDQGDYVAVVLNANGFSVSFPASLELNYLPIIEGQSESPAFADPGSVVVLSVSATTRTPPLTYEWFLDGNPVFQDLAQPLDSVSFVASSETAGTYTCVVANEFDSVEIEPIQVILDNSCTPNAVILRFDPQLDNHWNSGYTMNVTMENNSPFDMSGWTVVWAFEEPSLQVESYWRSTDLTFDADSSYFSLTNDEFNQAIEAGNLDWFGLTVGEWSPELSAKVSSALINGVTCEPPIKFCCKPQSADEMEALFQVTDFTFPPPPLEEDYSQYTETELGLNGVFVRYNITNIWSIGYTASIEIQPTTQNLDNWRVTWKWDEDSSDELQTVVGDGQLAGGHRGYITVDSLDNSPTLFMGETARFDIQVFKEWGVEPAEPQNLMAVPTLCTEIVECSCISLTFEYNNTWNDGFSGNIFVHNNMPSPIEDWSVTLQLLPDEQIYNVFRGSLADPPMDALSLYKIVPEDYNSVIAPGEKDRVRIVVGAEELFAVKTNPVAMVIERQGYEMLFCSQTCDDALRYICQETPDALTMLVPTMDTVLALPFFSPPPSPPPPPPPPPFDGRIRVFDEGLDSSWLDFSFFASISLDATESSSVMPHTGLTMVQADMQQFGSFHLIRPEGFSATGVVEVWYTLEEDNEEAMNNLVFVFNGTEFKFLVDYTMGPTEDNWYYATIPLGESDTIDAENTSGEVEPAQINELEIRSFYSENITVLFDDICLDSMGAPGSEDVPLRDGITSEDWSDNSFKVIQSVTELGYTKIESEAWGAYSLQREDPFGEITAFAFDIKPLNSTKIRLQFRDSENNLKSDTIELDDLLGSKFSIGDWVRVVIDISEQVIPLGGLDLPYNRFQIGPREDATEFLVNNIVLGYGNHIDIWRPVNSGSGSISTPPVSPTDSVTVVFDDQLSTQWTDASWNIDTNLQYETSASINTVLRFTALAKWAAWSVEEADEQTTLQEASSMSFWLAAEDNWKLRVGLRTADGYKSVFWSLWSERATTSVLGAWYYYTINIPDIFGDENPWNRIVFQSVDPFASFMLDDLKIITSSSASLPTPGPTAAPPSISTPGPVSMPPVSTPGPTPAPPSPPLSPPPSVMLDPPPVSTPGPLAAPPAFQGTPGPAPMPPLPPALNGFFRETGYVFENVYVVFADVVDQEFSDDSWSCDLTIVDGALDVDTELWGAFSVSDDTIEKVLAMQPIVFSFFLRAIDTWEIRIGLRAGEEKSEFWFLENQVTEFSNLGDWIYYTISVSDVWGTDLSWDRIVFQAAKGSGAHFQLDDISITILPPAITPGPLPAPEDPEPTPGPTSAPNPPDVDGVPPSTETPGPDPAPPAIPDTTIPQLTILGFVAAKNNLVVQCTEYVDAGVIATDDQASPEVLAENVVVSGPRWIPEAGILDTTQVGTTVITYDVEDLSGNKAVTKSRHIKVVAPPGDSSFCNFSDEPAFIGLFWDAFSDSPRLQVFYASDEEIERIHLFFEISSPIEDFADEFEDQAPRITDLSVSGGEFEASAKSFKWNTKKQRLIIQGGENIVSSENGLLMTLDVTLPLLQPGISANSLPQVCCVSASVQVGLNSLKNVILPSCTPNESSEDISSLPPSTPPAPSLELPPSFLG